MSRRRPAREPPNTFLLGSVSMSILGINYLRMWDAWYESPFLYGIGVLYLASILLLAAGIGWRKQKRAEGEWFAFRLCTTSTAGLLSYFVGLGLAAVVG